jgi:hypothetical protein
MPRSMPVREQQSRFEQHDQQNDVNDVAARE